MAAKSVLSADRGQNAGLQTCSKSRSPHRRPQEGAGPFVEPPSDEVDRKANDANHVIFQ